MFFSETWSGFHRGWKRWRGAKNAGFSEARGNQTARCGFPLQPDVFPAARQQKEKTMNRIIWAVGAIVIILAILSYAGFR